MSFSFEDRGDLGSLFKKVLYCQRLERGLGQGLLITVPDPLSPKFDPLLLLYNHILKVIFGLCRPEIKPSLPELRHVDEDEYPVSVSINREHLTVGWNVT